MVSFMNYQVINIAQALQKMQTSVKKKLAAALVGAALDTMIQILKIFLFNQMQSPISIKLLYKVCLFISSLGITLVISNIAADAKKRNCFAALFVSVWILEGYLQWILSVLNQTGQMWTMVALTWIFSLCMCYTIKLYQKFMRMESGIAEVIIVMKGIQYKVRGLIDTGNHLYDPYQHRPVHILEKRIIEETLQDEGERYLYIPYQSLGEEQGILPVCRVEQLIIHTKCQDIVLNNQLVGLTDLSLNTHKSYQMLLHADSITGQQEGKMIC